MDTSVITKEWLENVFQTTSENKQLLDTIQIDQLLESIQNHHTDYLENQTIQSITDTIFNIIRGYPRLSVDTQKKYCFQLQGYRFVRCIYELHPGKLVKVLPIQPNQKGVSLKGIVMNIKFLDNGTHIVCMTPSKTFCQFKFDNYYTFQKLSSEEELLLTAFDLIQSET